MSIPEEKRRALDMTREWLFQLLDRRYRPKISEIRERACRLLRHYPWAHDAELMERALNEHQARGMRRLARKLKETNDAEGRERSRRDVDTQGAEG